MTLETLDLSNLREAIGDDKELEQELFEEFISSTTEILESLNIDCTHDEWRQKSHALKGLCANLGAMKMSDLCMQSQDMSEGSANQKHSLFVLIQSEHKTVVDLLNSE